MVWNPRGPRRWWMLTLAMTCLLLLGPAGAAAGEPGEREDAPAYIVVYGSAAAVDRGMVAAGRDPGPDPWHGRPHPD